MSIQPLSAEINQSALNIMDGISENIRYAPTAVGSGAYADGANGFGGGGMWPLLLLLLAGNRRGGGLFGGGGDDGCCSNPLTAILAAIANGKDVTIGEGRTLLSAICESEKTNLQQFYAAAIQAANNTQAIKDQATGYAIVADKRFDDLAAAGVAQTAAILAKLNETEISNLRDQLFGERRRGDAKDIEISINNINQQQQQQFTTLNHEFNRRFDVLFNQVAKASQDIISVGSVLTGVSQAANPVNVKS